MKQEQAKLANFRHRLVEARVMIYTQTKILNDVNATLGDKMRAIAELDILVKIENTLKE